MGLPAAYMQKALQDASAGRLQWLVGIGCLEIRAFVYILGEVIQARSYRECLDSS